MVYKLNIAVFLSCLLLWTFFAEAELKVSIGGDTGRIEDNGSIYINNDFKGKITTTGDVVIGGNTVGRLEPNGKVYLSGQLMGKLDYNGNIFIANSYIGQIQDNGKIFIRSNTLGRCNCVTYKDKLQILGYLAFFTDQLMQSN